MNELVIEYIRKIEGLKEGVKAYSYLQDNWLEIAISDYDFYRENEDLKNLEKEIRNVLKEKHSKKVVFVYRAYNDAAFKLLKNKEIIK